MMKNILSGITICVLMLMYAPHAKAANYEFDAITTGDTSGRKIEATNKEKFVWRGSYTFENGATSDALIYYDGNNYRPITSPGQYNSYNVVMDDEYIAYIYCGSSGTNCQIYLYDIATANTLQITSDDFTAKGSLFMGNHKLAWYGAQNAGASGNPSEIFLYDIDTQNTSQITHTTSYINGVPANVMPVIINTDLYWVNQRLTIKKMNIQTNEITDIFSGKAIENMVSDGLRVAWLAYPDQSTSGATSVYFFDGTNIHILMDTNFSSSNLKVKSNYIGWNNNGKAYVYRTSSDDIINITQDGSLVNIEGDKVAYLERGENYGGNIVYEPKIFNLLTNVIDVIGFFPGRVNGLIALGPSSVAWSGSYLSPQNGDIYSTYDQIYIGHPATKLSAPLNLNATSPTDQKPLISWSAIQGADYYNIYRDGILIGNTTETNYTDNSVSVDGTYTYSVAGVRSNTEGNLSSITVVYNTTSLDAVPPNISGSVLVQPNIAGWHKMPVIVYWTSVDPSPSSGTPTTPPPTIANLEGVHTYISDQSCDPLNNCASGSYTIKLDTVLPSGMYSGSTLVLKALNQTIKGSAADVTSGIAKIEISDGINSISSQAGDITLSCDSGNHNCTWIASPSKLASGIKNLTLKITDQADNAYTTTKQYIIL